MNLPLVIYLISVADGIGSALNGLAMLQCIAFAVCGSVAVAALVDSSDDMVTKMIRLLKLQAIALGVVAVLLALVPTEKTAYTMLAAYGVESVVTSDAAQRIAPKSLELIETFIDSTIEEAKK